VIVLDTHCWIWFQSGDSRLTPSIASRIGRDSILSVATIWETLLLVEKGRIRTGLPPEQTVRKWLAESPMRVIPIDTEIAILSRTLPFEHEDPADRYIAATAIANGSALATLDSRLLKLSWLKTIS